MTDAPRPIDPPLEGDASPPTEEPIPSGEPAPVEGASPIERGGSVDGTSSVADDRSAAPSSRNDQPPEADRRAELRELLLGPELKRIDALESQVRDLVFHLVEAQQVIDTLPARDGGSSAGVEADRVIETARDNAQRTTGRRFSWWLESIQTGQRYQDVCDRYTLVHRVERVVLIHRGTRDVLHHLWMSEAGVPPLFAQLDTVIDAALRAGEPTAEIETRTVFLARSPRLALAAVVRGESPAGFAERLASTVDAIESAHEADLDLYHGDASVFQPAHVSLRECLGESRRDEPLDPASARVHAATVTQVGE